MKLVITADGTVRDISDAPADADDAYLALTMHLRPVVTIETLASTLGDMKACAAAMDRGNHLADPVRRAYLSSEMDDLRAEAVMIASTLAAAGRAA